MFSIILLAFKLRKFLVWSSSTIDSFYCCGSCLNNSYSIMYISYKTITCEFKKDTIAMLIMWLWSSLTLLTTRTNPSSEALYSYINSLEIKYYYLWDLDPFNFVQEKDHYLLWFTGQPVRKRPLSVRTAVVSDWIHVIIFSTAM